MSSLKVVFREEFIEACKEAIIPVSYIVTAEKVSIEKKISICQRVLFRTLAKSQFFTYP
jgi:hypothetical protein